MHPSVDLRARALVWRDARRVPLAQHQAVIVPYVAASPRLIARCFHIFIDHCAVVRAFLLPGLGKRRGRWCCDACRLVLRNKTRMVEHALEPVEKQAEESQRSYPERMTTTSYASDLTDGQWEIRKPFFPVATTGRPRQYPYRTFINAMRYLLRSGSQWRLLPQEFPPWKRVYYYFRHWRIDGTWPRIPTALREQERLRLGRHGQHPG